MLYLLEKVRTRIFPTLGEREPRPIFFYIPQDE